jgi:putative transposase
MPNHVHLVLTPTTSEGLAREIGETHRQYTGFINARARWTGHLFQGRFSSVPLDEAHLVAAARYVALNPMRARLVACAEEWAWSSARAHLAGRDDGLVRVAPLLDRIGRFCDLIDSENGRLAFAALRASETTGRALGSSDFVATLERATGRRLRPKKLGRKPSAPTDQRQLRMQGMNSEARETSCVPAILIAIGIARNWDRLAGRPAPRRRFL